MDLQEEDRAGDDAQVAWEEEGAVLTEHCDEEGGGQRGGEACLGLQGSCVAGQAIFPHPIPASPPLQALSEGL